MLWSIRSNAFLRYFNVQSTGISHENNDIFGGMLSVKTTLSFMQLIKLIQIGQHHANWPLLQPQNRGKCFMFQMNLFDAIKELTGIPTTSSNVCSIILTSLYWPGAPP